MVRGPGLIFLTTLALVLAGVIGSSSDGAAQSASDRPGAVTDFSSQAQQKKGGPGRSASPRGPAGPGRAGPPSLQRSAAQPGFQRGASQPRIERNVGQPRIQRNVGQPRIQGTVGQQPRFQRDIGQRGIGQTGPGLRAASIRGASRATIGGRNYSIWRGSHRVRRGGNWRTFVGLSTLGALMFGSAYYYPYAYIDAPAPYCEGLTEDGCQLQWREVPTIEGPMEYQCVAYCPWH